MDARSITNAINEHSKWLENLQKIKICNVPPSDNFIKKNSHKLCNFGIWLESHHQELEDMNKDLFYEIYTLHKELHQLGKEILEAKMISLETYDNFIDKSKLMKKKLREYRAKSYK